VAPQASYSDLVPFDFSSQNNRIHCGRKFTPSSCRIRDATSFDGFDNRGGMDYFTRCALMTINQSSTYRRLSLLHLARYGRTTSLRRPCPNGFRGHSSPFASSPGAWFSRDLQKQPASLIAAKRAQKLFLTTDSDEITRQLNIHPAQCWYGETGDIPS